MDTRKPIGQVSVSGAAHAIAGKAAERSFDTDRRTARATLRAGIGRLALVLSGAVLAAGIFAGPVAAAGSTTNPDVRACLTWGGGVAYANQPVFLMRWNASTAAWDVARQTQTNSNGCVRWNDLATNRYFSVVGYKVYPTLSRYYIGESTYFLTSANDHLFTRSIYVDGPFSL